MRPQERSASADDDFGKTVEQAVSRLLTLGASTFFVPSGVLPSSPIVATPSAEKRRRLVNGWRQSSDVYPESLFNLTGGRIILRVPMT